MKLDRRTALLGLLSTALLRSQGQSLESRSTLKLVIPDFSTLEFEYMGKTVSFSAAEIMTALRAVEIPKSQTNKSDDHYTPDGCFWSDYEEKNVCE